jgi:predicted transcriptional regulator
MSLPIPVGSITTAAPGGDRLAAETAGRSAVDSRLHPRAARQGRVLSSLRTTGGGRFPALDSGGKRNCENLRVPQGAVDPVWGRYLVEKTRRRDFDMSSLAEIQEAIEKLASEDRARLRDWFNAQDVEETDEVLAAIDEGIRSAETERTFSLEEVRAEIKKWASKSA